VALTGAFEIGSLTTHSSLPSPGKVSAAQRLEG
jgi:hypothetical protein